MATANEQMFLGIILVVLSAILLLSGLGIVQARGIQSYIFSREADIFVAFAAFAFGLFHIFAQKT